MEINVTLGEVKTQEPKPFPKLMISSNGTIVLFHKPRYGFVIKAGEKSTNDITDSPEGWSMHCFTDYNEPITIQNA